MKRATLILALILLSLLAGCIEPEQVAEDNLAPYRQSLLSAFQGDIPRATASSSASTADALTLTGHQQVFYTNNEDSKLGEIYFCLYPNLPQSHRGNSMDGQRMSGWGEQEVNLRLDG